MSRKKRAARFVSLPTNSKQVRIQSWLMQEGWQIGEAQSDQANWAMTVSNQVGHVLVIVQPKHASDLIVIQVEMTFDDEFRKHLAKLSPKNRQDLFWDIRFTLIDKGIDFDGVTEPLTSIKLSQRIYDDALTKDEFIRRFGKARNAMLAVGWRFNQAFEQSPPDLTGAFTTAGQVH